MSYYERKYKDLFIVEVKEKHRQYKHGDYKFLIMDKAVSHCAFRTEAGLNRFLKDTGLILRWREQNEAVNIGTLYGEYRDICAMISREHFENIHRGGKLFKSFRLCNGDYTAHYCSGKGLMIHLNPNIRDREVIKHFHE